MSLPPSLYERARTCHKRNRSAQCRGVFTIGAHARDCQPPEPIHVRSLRGGIVGRVNIGGGDRGRDRGERDDGYQRGREGENEREREEREAENASGPLYRI